MNADRTSRSGRAWMVKMAGVRFSDIESAFLFAGSAPYGTDSAYLNLMRNIRSPYRIRHRVDGSA